MAVVQLVIGLQEGYQHGIFATFGGTVCVELPEEVLVPVLGGQCIKEQEIVISGMAKGIDACAGTVCVNSGSYTVAIVGNGLDICYPAEHERLMERIRETGLLLSEYPPGTEPSNYTFPQRNRLIASWSDRLIVIAAGRGSGAMITANCADKYGRKVSFY